MKGQIVTTSLTMTSIELLEVVNQARALHGEGEIRRNDFTTRCLDELDGEHYETFVVRNPNGTASEAIRMTRDQCMYVLMRESKAVRRTAAEQLNKPVAPAIPTTLSAALRLAADQAEQIEQQQARLALAEPKAAFVEKYVEATGLKGFRQVAKLLQVKENQFRKFLADRKIMYRLGGEWVPYAPHLEAGRFEVKTGTSLATGHAFSEAKFTAKGIEWVAGLMASERVSSALKGAPC